jgi:hypothetical protein
LSALARIRKKLAANRNDAAAYCSNVTRVSRTSRANFFSSSARNFAGSFERGGSTPCALSRSRTASEAATTYLTIRVSFHTAHHAIIAQYSADLAGGCNAGQPRGDDMKVTKHAITALVLAALPFVITIGDRAARSVNGIETVVWDYNYAGVIFGFIALLVLYMGVRDLHAPSASKPEPRAPHYAMFAAIGLLAIYQAAKGASLI